MHYVVLAATEAAPAAPFAEAAPVAAVHAPEHPGAIVPHEAKRVEDGETEAGTIVHMERATQKIEHDKLITRAKAWEEDTKSRIESRSEREEAKIAQEELTMKNKAEARLRRNEEKLEKQKAKYMEMMKNEVAAAHKAAEEKRALAAAKKGQEMLKAEETAAKIRATGIFPKKFGCFAA
ncbi:hypothetical protein M758_7G119900 [Ceratodon purpureus]|nr:hypothetical protein M758_7G119900 [Ceratodon purpureus]